MNIPTIEELVAPHLERLRREAEAKRGEKVGQVMLWFEQGSAFGKPEGGYRYVALVYFGDSASRSVSGHGDDVDEAIAKCVADIKPLPDVAAILGIAH